MDTWFTSDTHFGHANIIKYCDRPWSSAEEMDEAIVERWNEKVGHDDVVYHLGDVSFHKNEHHTAEILNSLNGQILIIPGNHDTHRTLNRIGLWCENATVATSALIERDINGKRIVLCHYAMRVWNKSHYGAWQLYGHSHGSLPDDPNALSMDVGVDPNNYAPVHFDEVAAHMATKNFKPVDHHK